MFATRLTVPRYIVLVSLIYALAFIAMFVIIKSGQHIHQSLALSLLSSGQSADSVGRNASSHEAVAERREALSRA